MLTAKHAPFVVEEHFGHLGGLFRVAVPGPEEQQHLAVVVGLHAQVPPLQKRAELGDPLPSLGGQVADVLLSAVEVGISVQELVLIVPGSGFIAAVNSATLS